MPNKLKEWWKNKQKESKKGWVKFIDSFLDKNIIGIKGNFQEWDSLKLLEKLSNNGNY